MKSINKILIITCVFVLICAFLFGQPQNFLSCPSNASTVGSFPNYSTVESPNGNSTAYLPIADGSTQNFSCINLSTNECDERYALWYVFNIAQTPCNPYLSAYGSNPFSFTLYGPFLGTVQTDWSTPPAVINQSVSESYSQSISMVNMSAGHYVLKINSPSCNGNITFDFGGDCFGFTDGGNVGSDGQNNGTGDQSGSCSGCIDYPTDCPTCPLCPTCPPNGTDGCGNSTFPTAYGAPCDECLPDFSPNTGDYLVSCWVKHVGADLSVTTSYNKPKILIEAVPSNTALNLTLAPTGPIIDGWQKIEEKFTLPANAIPAVTDFKITLFCAGASGSCLFDDIRIFPFDASLKSYVYDPKTLRFMAELDERNFATFYEYDEEGKLIRVKKETERGVMTIQENRNYTVKQP